MTIDALKEGILKDIESIDSYMLAGKIISLIRDCLSESNTRPIVFTSHNKWNERVINVMPSLTTINSLFEVNNGRFVLRDPISNHDAREIRSYVTSMRGILA